MLQKNHLAKLGTSVVILTLLSHSYTFFCPFYMHTYVYTEVLVYHNKPSSYIATYVLYLYLSFPFDILQFYHV